MKTLKMLYVLLAGLGLFLSASAAFAGPVDPTVIINKKDPSTVTTFSSNSVTDPLVINLVDGLASLEGFEYTGTKTLTELFIQLDGALTDEQFACVSNIFTGCGAFSTGSGDEVGLIFSDGKITSGEEFTVAVTSSTPEPAPIVLVLTGGLLLAGLSRRW
jgi:hypothetical protein